MADDLTILRYVSWRDICPWLLLFRVFRVATSIRVLSLAFIAVLLTTVAWNFSRTCCLSSDSLDDSELAEIRRDFEAWPSNRNMLGFDRLAEVIRNPQLRILDEMSPVTTSFETIVEPFIRLLGPTTRWDQRCYWLLGGTLSIVLWSFFGLAIARISTVRLGRGEVIGLSDAIGFSFSKWVSCVASPFMPMMATLLLSLPLMLVGLLMRADIGVAIAGILWLLVIVVGVIMTGLSIGLLFGWPLMWGTIATESSDAFDAVSRSFSYTFCRPLQYLFYACVAIALGVLGWIVVWFFTEAIIQSACWAVAIGTGQERWDQIGNAMKAVATDVPTSRAIGVWMLGFFNAAVRTVVTGFNFGFFWTAAAAIYLLLRMDTDQTELDDIYFADEDSSVSPLPQFETDAAGGPSATTS